GSLGGITESLPYLADLGVTCLWLSPIFPSPSHHGYDATDYFSVEPRLGTLEDLRALCVAAHDRGIRILLDFVANRHPAFRHAIANPDAPERDWFTFTSWPTSYRTFFGVSTMPRLNTDHPQVRAYLIDAAQYWLLLGIDGFRLDYANGPSHAFWTAFRASTQTVSSDAALIGEVVETAELQRSYLGRLDGTLDFLLLQQFRAFFAFDAITASMFDTFLRRHLGYFPATFILPSFLDNHDMNRFLWIAQGDKRRLKLAALCQFTLPHPPIVYYGTEVGLSQRRDLTHPDGSRRLEESRLPMLWGEEQDRDLLAYYRSLIAARRARPSLWRGKRTTLLCDDEGLLAVKITQGDDLAIVALNRTQARQQIQMPERLMITVATEAGV
ncbi:MAG: alpha-amylase, partial [Chloroflexota bacterium]